MNKLKKTAKYSIYRVAISTRKTSLIFDEISWGEARDYLAEYLRKSRDNNEKIITIAKEKYQREYLITKDKNAYILKWNRTLICPICEDKYLDSTLQQCSVCSWNLDTYPLTPDGLRQEQENRIEWAREIWRQRQHLLQERREIEARKEQELKDTIDYLLSESTKIETQRDQLLNERQLDWRNSDIDSEIKKVRTFTADLPFEVAETIKDKFPTSERGKNRNTWLNKVIIDAAIKEGLLETTLYWIESSRVYFAVYQQNILYLVLSDYKLYNYSRIDWITFKLFLNQKSKGEFLNNHQKDVFNNPECLKAFPLWGNLYEFYEELEDLNNVDETFCEYKNIFPLTRILESYVGEITHFKHVRKGNLLV